MTTMPIDPNEFLLSQGVPAAKFPTPGTTVEGVICTPPEVQQQTDFETGKLLYWDDGKPRLQLVITVETSEPDPETPGSNRQYRIYGRGNLLAAIRTAVRTSGARALEVGGRLSVTYTHDGEPRKRGYHPPKMYTAVYTPPQAAAVVDLLGDDDQPAAQPAAPAAPVQPAAPAAPVQPAAPAAPVQPAAPAAPVQPASLTDEQKAALAALTPEQRAALGLNI